MKAQSQIYLPPAILVGELFPWKGYTWKVQAFSPNGGEIMLSDEKGEQKAIASRAVLVLEMRGRTTGHLKKTAAAKKRKATVKVNGYRPKSIGWYNRPEKPATDR